MRGQACVRQVLASIFVFKKNIWGLPKDHRSRTKLVLCWWLVLGEIGSYLGVGIRT